jgi:putative transposase
MVMKPIQSLILCALAGWLNREQAAVIEYLLAENRTWRELNGSKTPRLNDDQRRRLAVKGKCLGRKLLMDFTTIVTPGTILRWHNEADRPKIRWEFKEG